MSIETTPGVSTANVKRWDVYDIADRLADIPWMLAAVIAGQATPGHTLQDIYGLLSELETELWQAADRGGSVGPYPDYVEA
jgi:hypothetical protein